MTWPHLLDAGLRVSLPETRTGGGVETASRKLNSALVEVGPVVSESDAPASAPPAAAWALMWDDAAVDLLELGRPGPVSG